MGCSEDDEVHVPWLTLKAQITTRTPGGNDQRGVQHNNFLRGLNHKPHPKCRFEHAETRRQSYIFIVSSNASISNDISISPNEESLGSSSIISEALPSSSGCELEGVCIFDGLEDFEDISE